MTPKEESEEEFQPEVKVLKAELNRTKTSYEQALAAVSPQTLDKFYSQLFQPGRSLDQARLQCPNWPEGAPEAGSLPSLETLEQIAGRLRREATLQSVDHLSEFVQRVRQRTEKCPGTTQSAILDDFISILQEELARENLAGTPIGELLEPLDRLLAKERMDRQSRVHADKLRQKERDQEMKMAQIKQAQAKLKLLQRQYKDKVKDAQKKIAQALRPASDGAVTRETLQRAAEALQLL